MLFNSFEFIFLFFPIALIGFHLLRRSRLALYWLTLTSLFFYGYWEPRYLILLLASVLVNYGFGKWITKLPEKSAPSRRVTAFGVVFNLALLGYFKYANFFVDETAALLGAAWSIEQILLPLVISFFTFQQIAYLIDTYQRKVDAHLFIEYITFVTFFPQLIAGPIVHHQTVLWQFRTVSAMSERARNLAVGVSIFALGLFKKAIIADELARYANAVFDLSLSGGAPSLAEAWGGALAYTFQLYFDFSGYSDMALALGCMFGIALPVNFASPYKAFSIIDFWRRWHITLSNFLRDYLYIPLGGNRFGQFARYRNLMTTMLLGGLWHGAGWNFVLWGGLHGIYLVINHLWRSLPFHSAICGELVYRLAAWGLTFLAVVLAWVFFRAETLDSAMVMLTAMTGGYGLDLPHGWSSAVGRADGMFPNTTVDWNMGVIAIFASAGIALIMPNVFDLYHKHLPADVNQRVPRDEAPLFLWNPTLRWAVVSVLLLGYALLALNEPSEFLYFQF